MKQNVVMMVSFLAAIAVSCAWQPPEPAMVIAGEEISRAELACPDRVPDAAEQCQELERMKTRRLLFDRMLDAALVTSGITIGPDVERQLDGVIASMEPSFRQHAEITRCHAIAALESMGEPVENDPSCGALDPRQVGRLADTLSRRELYELVEDDLMARMTEAQRANLRAEASLRLIRNQIAERGQNENEFWTGIYDSLDPKFYDARLAMGPAEVVTGSPAGWRRTGSS